MTNVLNSAGIDPTGQQSSSQAVQCAINSVGSNGEVYLPAGAYLLSNLGYATAGRLRIRGDGPATQLIVGANSGSIFSASAGIVAIQDLTVMNPVAGASTAGHFFDFSGGRFNLRNIDFYNGYSLAKWGDGCEGGGATEIYSAAPSANGFDVDVSPSLTGGQGGKLIFDKLNFQATSANNGIGLNMVSGDTIIGSNSNIAGFNINVAGITSSTRSYLANLFFTNFVADGAGGPEASNAAWYFDGTSQFLARLFVDNSWAGSMGNTGMYLKNVKTGRIAGTEIIQNGGSGLIIDTGCRDIRIRDNPVTGNSRTKPGAAHGIVILKGADRIRLNGNRSGPTYNGTLSSFVADTQGYGIIVADPSVINYTMEDNDCSGNMMAGICDLGGGQLNVTKFIGGNTVGAFNP
ncbi:hypothetical protein [Caballeronia sordidicola]|uniref:Pectate lyase superfamily protein domain-containing protein n=1 Tax=Caballeronia sordidicola TaxID=196367 RepID=A0A242N7C5_CABSO|nr:hypothetical protein [Caballeronia sordidicola]OTP79502.1 hypothetical protein PAMC26577_01145 [Caballeronia sordidicola]